MIFEDAGGACYLDGIPKIFQLFFIDEKVIYFRIFSYDLEIAERFGNTTRSVRVHRRKHRNFHSVHLVYISGHKCTCPQRNPLPVSETTPHVKSCTSWYRRSRNPAPDSTCEKKPAPDVRGGITNQKHFREIPKSCTRLRCCVP